MTYSAAAPLVSLFFLSSFAAAAISAPDCSLTWKWSFNSLGQNPCTVAAYLVATCQGGSYTVNPLIPGWVYAGANASISNLCWCNTIVYSLLSACGGCQGGEWITWSRFAYNCTIIKPPGSFPNPIPEGTRLQQWALLDVTSENTWNLNRSYTVGGTPELGPGTIPGLSGSSGSASTGPSSTYSSTPTSSSSFYSTSSSSRGSSSNSASPIPVGGHSSNTVGIAGGVAGSIAAISVVIAALLFYWRRRHPPAPSAPPASDGQPSGFNSPMDQVPQPMLDPGTVVLPLPDTTTSMLRPYNPDDLATYSTDQGRHSPPPTYDTYSIQSPSGPSSSSSKNPYTAPSAPAPNLKRQGIGSSGLPTV